VQITAQELANRIDGQLDGDSALRLTGIAPIARAGPADVTFAENEKHCAAAEISAAATVIVPVSAPASRKTLIRVKNPRAAFARALAVFFPARRYPAQIDNTAQVGRNVQLGQDVFIGAHAVLRDNVIIGNRCVIEANCFLGEGAKLGDDCLLYPGVTVYHGVRVGDRVIIHAGSVIGSDGFGYVQDGAQRIKIPQVGDVVIEDDVEIGANVTIDRATIDSTIVRRGTKIDNLVQIAHNVTVGQNCLIIAQVGIAGSVQIGNNVTLAGQVGVADHLKIGDNSVVGAQGGVIADLPPGSVVWGTPTQPVTQLKRQLVALRKLPELLRKLAQRGITDRGE
jgi:UDP-3-O-[3-hydroxymyristoyl] glucosamine N-acyltransferase